jgi:hypothetical protein
MGASTNHPRVDNESEIRRVLTVLGYTIKDNAITKVSHDFGGAVMMGYNFEIMGIGNAAADSNETHGTFIISTQREWDMVRGIGRTGAKKWANEAQAKQYLLSKLAELAAGQAGALSAWKYTLDSTDAQGRKVSGSLDSTYDFTFSGYPMVDRFCGYKVKLDPQDGALASFRKGSRPPQLDPPFTPFSEAAARARAASLGYRMTSSAETTAKLGWAVPTGATRATLAYYLKPTARDETSGHGYMVEAKANGRHWTLGP